MPEPTDTPPASARAVALRELVDVTQVRPLRLAVEAGARAVRLAEALADEPGRAPVPVEVVPVPLVAVDPHTGPDRVTAFGAAVRAVGGDLGVLLDDTGELVVLDETGERVDPGSVAVVVALRVVAVERAAGRTPVVAHDVLASRALPDLAGSAGARIALVEGTGTSVRGAPGSPRPALAVLRRARFRVGDLDAAESAVAAALHLLAALGSQPHPLSALAELHQPYNVDGPVPEPVRDAARARARVAEAYVAEHGAGPVEAHELHEPDTLVVTHWDESPQWWFALSTSPSGDALTLDVEAADEDIMEKVRDDVLALVREGR